MPDMKDLADDSTRVREFNPDEFATVVKGKERPVSPFKDNGKDGRFVTLDGQIHHADAKGKWEIKNGASYPAMIGSYRVEVLREKDYYIKYLGKKQPKGVGEPTFRLFDIRGFNPEFGREVSPDKSLSKGPETEVALEDTNLLRRITASPPEK